MKLKHNEVEYKYSAEGISHRDFHNLMLKLSKKYRIKIKRASSNDFYFTNSNGDFIRFRDSKMRPELTTKKKLNKKNNWNRIEVNLHLKNKLTTLEEVKAFCETIGFDLNFSIFKSCTMYFLKDLNFVFYTVYRDGKTAGSFIEIEYCESEVKGKTLKSVYKILDKFESLLKPLGISKSQRLSKSLFELFRRGAGE